LQIEKEISEIAKNIENSQILRTKSHKRKNVSKSKTDINVKQIEQECDINKHMITVPNILKIVGKRI